MEVAEGVHLHLGIVAVHLVVIAALLVVVVLVVMWLPLDPVVLIVPVVAVHGVGEVDLNLNCVFLCPLFLLILRTFALINIYFSYSLVSLKFF